MSRLKIINVVGARPNFIKIAPIMSTYRKHGGFEPLLVHTGQHYDQRMSDRFFRELEIPAPDVNLGVGSGSQAQQTAGIMTAFEPVVLKHKPDAVLVVGDVTGTLACALVAAKLGVRLVHIEAGLRSFDRSMPEEINRVITDAISDLLFVTEPGGVDNLLREGIAPGKIHLVGNVMIDSLLNYRARAEQSRVLEELNLESRRYALLTLHRAANVDHSDVLSRVLDALQLIDRELPIIFPIHPRTRDSLDASDLRRRIASMSQLRMTDPAGYFDFIKLMAHARLVLTDSGGIQEETTVLGVPCLTLRDNTERPITIECGTNRLVGTQPQTIIKAFHDVMNAELCECRTPPLWDGKAAERIVQTIFNTI